MKLTHLIQQIIKEEIECLQEELLGHIKYKSSKEKFEVYKNPKSITRMEPNCRLFYIDRNLFLVNDSAYNIIHSQLYDWLKLNHFIKSSHPNKYYDSSDILALQRKNNTKNLYISESYTDDEIPAFYDIIKQAQKQFPQYKFIPKII